MYIGGRSMSTLAFLLFILNNQGFETRPRGLLAKAELINWQVETDKRWQEWAAKANQKRIEQLRKEVQELKHMPVRFNSFVLPPQFS